MSGSIGKFSINRVEQGQHREALMTRGSCHWLGHRPAPRQPTIFGDYRDKEADQSGD